MHNYKELNVWIKAVEFAVEMYSITKSFPEDEQFGLTTQLRRATVLISSNIAEGSGRNSDKEFIHFLSIASGYSFEVQTQLIIAYKLNYLSETIFYSTLQKVEEIQKMCKVLSNKLSSAVI